MKFRDKKTTEKVTIVDGKILEKQAIPSFREKNTPLSNVPDTFLEELNQFSLDLGTQHNPKIPQNGNGITNTDPVKQEEPEDGGPPPPRGIEEAQINDFRLVEGILIPKNQAYLPEEFRPELLMKDVQAFCPYFTQDDISDYGLFMDFLVQTGIGKRTRYDYTVSLRKWKKDLTQLGGDISIDNLNTILRSVSPARGQNLLLALKAYARYRNFHQDSKLLILLSTSLTLYKPTQSPRQKRVKATQAVTREEAEHYKALAKDLCREHKKEGIWIGLSLLGVPPNNMTSVEFPDKSHIRFMQRRKEKKARIEQWLHNACHAIEGWRLGRRTVHRGVAKYEITPMALNQYASHRK